MEDKTFSKLPLHVVFKSIIFLSYDDGDKQESMLLTCSCCQQAIISLYLSLTHLTLIIREHSASTPLYL